MTTELGRLEKVDLRQAWLSEASDFTPWLAQEENIRLLGDTIGIDLEVEAQEKNVGPFRADILCKDTANGQWVLVENQLARSDHTHLGQLMTYAAGLNAVTIVWIVERFTEEHRAALDWLNEITSDDFNFFGLEVELWRIGGSPIAPKFNVVSKPNDWTQSVSDAKKGIEATGPTETKKLQLEYWTEFRKLMEERGGSVDALSKLPLAGRVIKQAHATLLSGVRGHDMARGKYRTLQNWIGSHNFPIEEAKFIPIAPNQLEDGMSQRDSRRQSVRSQI